MLIGKWNISGKEKKQRSGTGFIIYNVLYVDLQMIQNGISVGPIKLRYVILI